MLYSGIFLFMVNFVSLGVFLFFILLFLFNYFDLVIVGEFFFMLMLLMCDGLVIFDDGSMNDMYLGNKYIMMLLFYLYLFFME